MLEIGRIEKLFVKVENVTAIQEAQINIDKEGHPKGSVETAEECMKKTCGEGEILRGTWCHLSAEAECQPARKEGGRKGKKHHRQLHPLLREGQHIEHQGENAQDAQEDAVKHSVGVGSIEYALSFVHIVERYEGRGFRFARSRFPFSFVRNHLLLVQR